MFLLKTPVTFDFRTNIDYYAHAPAARTLNDGEDLPMLVISSVTVHEPGE